MDDQFRLSLKIRNDAVRNKPERVSVRSLLMVIGISVLASGCSVKMLYNNMDRFARWGVNDYIEMDDEQRAYFDEEIDALLYWHRTEELPRYADYLESLEPTLRGGTDAEEFQGVVDSLYTWFESLETRAMPMFTEMLLSLSNEQVERLPSRLNKDNKEFSEDEDDKAIADIQKDWWQSYADIIGRFSGKLNREQKDYLASQSIRYIPQFGLWADYRRRWQADLMDLLENGRSDPEAFSAAFITLTDQRESYYGEELTAIFAANEQLASEVSAWLINDFDDKQRERFFERTGELAQTFRELSEDVPDQVPLGGGCLVRC